jgi:ADP-heptose:LPS heptosyltransferase
MARQRTILFLIRDKMGDSLIAANVALAFARAHPEWSVSMMIRDAYAYPLVGEPQLKIIPYRTGMGALLRAWWWRLSGRRFDVLGVMRGFGKRTVTLIKNIPADQIVAHDIRLAAVATEVVVADQGSLATDPHYGPALRVAQALDPKLAEPHRLCFPELKRRWQAARKKYLVICPMSDERRRNIPAESINALHAHLQARHPDLEVLVLVRERQDVAIFVRPPEVSVTAFHDIPNLIELLLQTSQFFGTDTGLLHLATAMGIPCVVFFGPTQPRRVLLPNQPGVVALRVSVLGDRHCDIKTCTSPACIARAVAAFTEQENQTQRQGPPNCPLEDR